MSIPYLFDTLEEYLAPLEGDTLSVSVNVVDGHTTYVLHGRNDEWVVPFSDAEPSPRFVVTSPTTLGHDRPDIRALYYVELRLRNPDKSPKTLQAYVRSLSTDDMVEYLDSILPVVSEANVDRGVLFWCDRQKTPGVLPEDITWKIRSLPSSFDSVKDLGLFSYKAIVFIGCDDAAHAARIARWLVSPRGTALLVDMPDIDPEIAAKEHFDRVEEIGDDTMLVA